MMIGQVTIIGRYFFLTDKHLHAARPDLAAKAPKPNVAYHCLLSEAAFTLRSPTPYVKGKVSRARSSGQLGVGRNGL